MHSPIEEPQQPAWRPRVLDSPENQPATLICDLGGYMLPSPTLTLIGSVRGLGGAHAAFGASQERGVGALGSQGPPRGPQGNPVAPDPTPLRASRPEHHLPGTRWMARRCRLPMKRSPRTLSAWTPGTTPTSTPPPNPDTRHRYRHQLQVPLRMAVPRGVPNCPERRQRVRRPLQLRRQRGRHHASGPHRLDRRVC